MIIYFVGCRCVRCVRMSCVVKTVFIIIVSALIRFNNEHCTLCTQKTNKINRAHSLTEHETRNTTTTARPKHNESFCESQECDSVTVCGKRQNYQTKSSALCTN